MSKHIRNILFLSLILVFIITACNLPSKAPATEEPNSIFTQAALTVQAQLTQSASFNTPTLPPAQPTNTLVVLPTAVPATLPPAASATPVCDQAQYVKDVTIADGTTFDPGETFTKTWRLRNAGTCTWSGYSLVFDSGDAMNGTSPIAIGTVNPGQEVDLSVTLTAPATSGSYRGYWRVRNTSGVLIPVLGGTQGKSFFVDIKVAAPGPFAVTSVSMSVSGSCGSFNITASITTNAAGSVTYHWIRSDGATDNATHTPIDFTAAGTQSVSTSWSTTASGAKWMDIYIDGPNHQQFGRAEFSCP
jgi:hypothetical protein